MWGISSYANHDKSLLYDVFEEVWYEFWKILVFDAFHKGIVGYYKVKKNWVIELRKISIFDAIIFYMQI